jgi:hypothetical protein
VHGGGGFEIKGKGWANATNPAEMHSLGEAVSGMRHLPECGLQEFPALGVLH